MTIEEALTIARDEVAKAARHGSTRHWIKARAVVAVTECPRCPAGMTERCRAVREHRGRELGNLHTQRYTLPAAVEVCAGIDEMYVLARRRREAERAAR